MDMWELLENALRDCKDKQISLDYIDRLEAENLMLSLDCEKCLENSSFLAEAAKRSSAKAIKQHLQSNNSVFYTENGYIVEELPSGEKNLIKAIDTTKPFDLRAYLKEETC